MQTSINNPTTGSAPNEAMQGGLGDPILQTQSVFRSVMDAMARPGTIKKIKTDARPPMPLAPLTGAILATLVDADTPLWLCPSLKAEARIPDWITFHVGAPIAIEAAQATFAVIDKASTMPSLEIFSQGVQDYPDRSATIIAQVDHLDGEADWCLTGPGIRDKANLRVETMSPLFLGQWADNNKLFPRGVDLILVAPDAVVCLPRTTHITPVENEER